MKIYPRSLTNKAKSLLPLIIFSLIILALIRFSPTQETFEYHLDEGIEAIKSSLFLKGFSLYKEIWSDQPPLFTVILACWFKLFGASFYQGRILVLIFLGLLLWTFHQTIKLSQGDFCAWTASIFLLLSCRFLNLGNSLMINIPSWALAMSSLLFLTLYNKNRIASYLVLSALSMALSLQIKFSPAFLIPALLLDLKSSSASKALNLKAPLSGLTAALFWIIAAAFFYFIISIFFFFPDWSVFADQLFKPHMAKLNLPGNNFRIIQDLLLQDFDIVIWALIGIIINIPRIKPAMILPFSWLCSGLAILAIHRPIWDYYYLFISLPLCWLGACGLTHMLNRASKELKSSPLKLLKPVNIFLAGLFFITISVFPKKLIRTKNSLWGETGDGQRAVVELLSQQKKQVKWLVTDMPTYAFYSGMLVPPEIAVATLKRRFTNGLTDSFFIAVLKKYQPELILLGEFQDYPPTVMSYINENYVSFAHFQFSVRTKGYLFPTVLPPVSRNYLGQYLPRRLRTINIEWFNNLIWHKLYIPTFSTKTNFQEFWLKNNCIEIFLRKDLNNQVAAR